MHYIYEIKLLQKISILDKYYSSVWVQKNIKKQIVLDVHYSIFKPSCINSDQYYKTHPMRIYPQSRETPRWRYVAWHVCGIFQDFIILVLHP